MGEISRSNLINLLINKTENLNFSGIDFSDEDLTGLDFSNTIMINTKFQRTNIGNLVLRNSKLENVRLKDSIGEPIFEETEMINCDVSHNTLQYKPGGTTNFKKSKIQNITLWGLKDFDYTKKHTNFEFTECEISGEVYCHVVDRKSKLKFNNCNLKNTFSCEEIGSLIIESCEIDATIKNFHNENNRNYQSDVIWVTDNKIKNLSLQRVDCEIEFKRNTISKALIRGNINNSDFSTNTFNSTIIHDSNIDKLYFFNNQVLGTSFQNSKIQRSSFQNNKFYESNFSTSTFDKCKFNNFNCISLKFNEIVFFDSIIEHSTFTNNKFSNVSFNNSELVLCTFENATFYECNFSSITNLDRTQFKNCKFTSCTGVEKIEAGIIKKGLMTWLNGGY